MVVSAFSQQVRARLGQPTLVEEDARGRYQGWIFSEEGVVVQQVNGHISTALVEVSITLCERILSASKRRLLLMDDLAGVTSYDSAARMKSVDWGIVNQDRIEGVHLLLKSKLIAMAVSVANIALRDPMKPYSEREPFELRLLEALRRPQRTPHHIS